MPGDTHTMHCTGFARLATPLRPIMDNLYMDTHFWFVPMRLVWSNWVNFMGERDEPDDDPDAYSIPQMPVTLGNIAPSSMLSYLGLPYRDGVTTPISVSALYTRAIALIYNEWYRDENLQSRVAFLRALALMMSPRCTRLTLVIRAVSARVILPVLCRGRRRVTR